MEICQIPSKIMGIFSRSSEEVKGQSGGCFFPNSGKAAQIVNEPFQGWRKNIHLASLDMRDNCPSRGFMYFIPGVLI